MGIKKIAKHLQDLLTETEGKRKKNTDAVSKLVRKLEKKKLKLNAKLAAAGSDKEKENLKRRLKVCEVHLEKGNSVLYALESKID